VAAAADLFVLKYKPIRFIIAALAGEDLFKNQKSIEELNGLLSEIFTELNDGIDRRIKKSANLIDKKRQKLIRQQTAYIVLFLVLWPAIYYY
jgi:hypothetical protein